MEKFPKIVYSKKSKVFSIEVNNKKSVDSNIRRNVVIDYDKQGNAVRVNIYEVDFDSFRNGRMELREFGRSADVAVLTR